MRKQEYQIKLLLILFICLATGSASLAQFRYHAAVPPVQESGYYKIAVTPAIAAKANASFSDIRLEDETGKNIPFILKTDLPVVNTRELKNFSLHASGRGADSNTYLIFDVGQAAQATTNGASSIVWTMKKANARREAILSGSHDLEHWYAVTDKIYLDADAEGTGVSAMQITSMPAGDYRYLKLIIKDKGLLPLEITGAGILLNQNLYQAYTPVPAPLWMQKDSTDQKSYLHISFQDNYPLKRLRFTVATPGLYKRNIVLYDTIGARKHPLGSGVLQPGSDSIDLSDFKAKVLFAEIENFDNEPLHFSNISAWQQPKYLVTELKSGHQYIIKVGAENLNQPVYDLEYFTNSLSVKSVKLEPADPVEQEKSGDGAIKAKNFASVWMWLLIGTALVALLLLSRTLIKNIAQNKQP